MRKAQATFIAQRQPNAFVDLEKFKGHSYPDVLISVLIETLESLSEWLDGGAVAPANRTSFWKRFLTGPQRPPLDRKKAAEVKRRIKDEAEELRVVLHSQDDVSVRRMTSKKMSGSSKKAVEVGTKGARVAGEAERTQDSSMEVTEELRRSKTDFLLRKVLEYQDLLREVGSLAGNQGFLLLDDLYQIPQRDQADVLDYFHRLTKDTGFWLKVGTIRHRTTWYRHGIPSIGMKIGDDVDEIDLDVTLEKYETAKRFLFRVLDGIAEEVNLTASGLLNDRARDRLVLASGGVARDFLSILRKSIAVAREKNTSGRIGAEDVNQAAGEHDSAKRDEVRRDVLDGDDQLLDAFEAMKRFCLEENNVNCFTIEKDLDGQIYKQVKELVDLRLLHSVLSRVTIRTRPTRIYEAYMIDVSQYTGTRSRRKLDMIEFWNAEGAEKLRSASLIYAERESGGSSSRTKRGSASPSGKA